jgi:hypothetical protein
MIGLSQIEITGYWSSLTGAYPAGTRPVRFVKGRVAAHMFYHCISLTAFSGNLCDHRLPTINCLPVVAVHRQHRHRQAAAASFRQ